MCYLTKPASVRAFNYLILFEFVGMSDASSGAATSAGSSANFAKLSSAPPFLRPRSAGACGEFFFTLSLLSFSICGVSRGHKGAFSRHQ